MKCVFVVQAVNARVGLTFLFSSPDCSLFLDHSSEQLQGKESDKEEKKKRKLHKTSLSWCELDWILLVKRNRTVKKAQESLSGETVNINAEEVFSLSRSRESKHMKSSFKHVFFFFPTWSLRRHAHSHTRAHKNEGRGFLKELTEASVSFLISSRSQLGIGC